MEENKGSTETIVSTGTGDTETKTYTEAEVQALLQSEADRRVTSALKKQKMEYENKMAEAERLRNMDEHQRKEYEYSQRLKELEAKERDFTIAQNKLEATKVLANRGIPVDFVDYVVADDAETMMANISTFETMFKSAVTDAVSKKIASPSPSTGFAKQTGLTKDEFKKLSISQKNEIYKTNPELWAKMTD